MVDTARFIPGTSHAVPLALTDAGWKKAGVDLKVLRPVPDGLPASAPASVPMFRLGGFDLAKMPGLAGIDLSDLQASVDFDLEGVVGADLLGFFRVTFADEGRFMWIEPDPHAPRAASRARRPASAG